LLIIKLLHVEYCKC